MQLVKFNPLTNLWTKTKIINKMNTRGLFLMYLNSKTIIMNHSKTWEIQFNKIIFQKMKTKSLKWTSKCRIFKTYKISIIILLKKIQGHNQLQDHNQHQDHNQLQDLGKATEGILNLEGVILPKEGAIKIKNNKLDPNLLNSSKHSLLLFFPT